jgi:hypothetical protein
MLLIIAGESHSWAYLDGLQLLENADAKYSFHHQSSSGPESYSADYLRGTKQFWGDYNSATGWLIDYGEEEWFTNTTGIARIKAGITYCNETFGSVISAFGFGWCNDMLGDGSATTDPVYGVHWFGTSVNGPEGSKAWGLDAADYSITGNSVCMDTYLNATKQYIDYCTAKGYPTKVFYTTGPVNTYGTDEARYQTYLKHEYIRNYVKADVTRILFDYADILCYNGDGTTSTLTWNGHTFPIITATNEIPEQTGHISNAGALRLGKAIWWMLARMAGWNGK